MDSKKDDPFKKAEERRPFFPAAQEPAKKQEPLKKADSNLDKRVSAGDDRGDTHTGPAGLSREAIKPIAERGSGESGRENQVETNPHKDSDSDQPKAREFSGDVRRPGSPDVS